MRHIPFAAFPIPEQNALLAVLRQFGLAARGVCASRVEWQDTELPHEVRAFTAVTTPGLTRAYPEAEDRCWLSALEQDLARHYAT
jgi:hypothetical protein